MYDISWFFPCLLTFSLPFIFIFYEDWKGRKAFFYFVSLL